MGGKQTEACGRCSVSTVVEAASCDRDGEPAEPGAGGANPFDGERIEVDEDELRSVVRHEVLFGRIKERLDEMATRLIYG